MNARTKNVLLIGGAVLLAVVFAVFGAGKFVDPAKWIGKFTVWDVPTGFVAGDVLVGCAAVGWFRFPGTLAFFSCRRGEVHAAGAA